MDTVNADPSHGAQSRLMVAGKGLVLCRSFVEYMDQKKARSRISAASARLNTVRDFILL